MICLNDTLEGLLSFVYKFFTKDFNRKLIGIARSTTGLMPHIFRKLAAAMMKTQTGLDF